MSCQLVERAKRKELTADNPDQALETMSSVWESDSVDVPTRYRRSVPDCMRRGQDADRIDMLSILCDFYG